MPDPLRIGLIGVDTSHSVAFTKCFNRADDPEHVPGAKVVAAYPGGSPDFDLSISRVEGFTKTLRDEYGVKVMSSPADVAGAVDLLVLGSCDGRVHLKQFKETVGFHRPTFIDKPIAVSMTDARAIFDLAARENTPVMSCSALRYAENLSKALAGEKAPVVSIDTFGPMAEQVTQPGLYWYGIHQVEVIQRVMGTGCKEAHAIRHTEQSDVITFTYGDGRTATMHGLRGAHHKFGAVLHREKDYAFVDVSGGKRSYYSNMLDALMATLPKRQSPIPPQATLEIIAMIEAANQSRQTGKPVSIA